MGLHGANDIELRLAGYVDGLVSVIGHADRAGSLRDYCTGLVMPCERNGVEPMAAITAPGRTAAQHQSLLHFVGQGGWSDALLEPTKGKAHATELARVWWANKDHAQGEVAELLTNWNLTINDLASRSYAAFLPVIDRLKGQIADAEKQRNDALRALEQHRASFAVLFGVQN